MYATPRGKAQRDGRGFCRGMGEREGARWPATFSGAQPKLNYGVPLCSQPGSSPWELPPFDHGSGCTPPSVGTNMVRGSIRLLARSLGVDGFLRIDSAKSISPRSSLGPRLKGPVSIASCARCSTAITRKHALLLLTLLIVDGAGRCMRSSPVLSDADFLLTQQQQSFQHANTLLPPSWENGGREPPLQRGAGVMSPRFFLNAYPAAHHQKPQRRADCPSLYYGNHDYMRAGAQPSAVNGVWWPRPSLLPRSLTAAGACLLSYYGDEIGPMPTS